MTTVAEPDLSSAVIPLLKGVVYRDTHDRPWQHLMQLQPQVRDYVATLGLTVVIDEAEGYAFLRQRPADEDTDDDKQLPRLIPRRSLSFPVSLLLALLRKKLAEFDAQGGDTRLMLTRAQLIETFASSCLPQATRQGSSTRSTRTSARRSSSASCARLRTPTRPTRSDAYSRRSWTPSGSPISTRSWPSTRRSYRAALTPRARTNDDRRTSSRLPAGSHRAIQLGHVRRPRLDAPHRSPQCPGHRRHRLGQVHDCGRAHHPAAARQPHLLQQGGRRRVKGALAPLIRPRPLQVRAGRDHRHHPSGGAPQCHQFQRYPRRFHQRGLRRDGHPRPGLLDEER